MADSSKDLQLRELKDMINDLKKMIKTLQATVDAANKREEALTQERDNLKEEVDLLRKKLFGSSSELLQNQKRWKVFCLRKRQKSGNPVQLTQNGSKGFQ